MPARRKPSPSSPATDPAPAARQPAAPAITRAEALHWWRAVYQACRQAAEHEHHAAAQWDRHICAFRAQRASDQQAKLYALLQDAIAALSSLFSDDYSNPPA